MSKYPIGRREMILLFGLFLFAAPLLWPGQRDAQKKFEYLSREHGLAQSTVNCIIQDSRGFLWFGTNDGLTMYDGYECTVYHYDPKKNGSIGSSCVSSLMEDRDGNVWMGSVLGGLSRYDPATGDFVRYLRGAGNGGELLNIKIGELFETEAGDVWVGSPGVLRKFDRITDSFISFPLDIDISAIYEDGDGHLWLGGVNSGLARFNPLDCAIVSYRNKPGDPRSIPDTAITGICAGLNGTIWIGTSGSGLVHFYPAEEVFTTYFSDSGNLAFGGTKYVYSVTDSKARPDILWAATAGGLVEFNMREKRLVDVHVASPLPDSLNSNHLISVFEDREGILWVGSYGDGLNKYSEKKNVFRSYRHQVCGGASISHDLVFSVIEDRDGNVWVGTEGGGLDMLDRSTGTVCNYRYDENDPFSLSSNFVRVVYQDRSGFLWVGTNGTGVNRFDPVAKKFTKFRNDTSDRQSLGDNFIRAIFEDHTGSLWIGTFNRGLDEFDRSKGIFRHYRHHPDVAGSLSSNSVSCIYEDSNHVMWVGTWSGGLNRFDRERETFLHFRENSETTGGISSDVVLSIFEDSRGILWIGTLGGGLNRFFPATGTFSWITADDGLPNNVIYGILEDGAGYLWLSTNNGLARFDPETGAVRAFDITDGLAGVEFNSGAYFRGSSGEFFFGGVKGLTSFFPENISTYRYVPPVQFTGFRVVNRELGLRGHISQIKELELSYKDTFTLEFSALSFASPAKNKYAYKLSGLHKEWISLGSKRTITFAHLEPGDYELQVMGSNADGVWNENGASIRLVIAPPFWQTWWFKLSLFGLLLGLAYYWHMIALKNATLKYKTESAMARLYAYCKLSDREQEIAALMMKGKSNKDIEDTLFISINTVKSHVYSIYRKMGVKNRLEMINFIQKSIRE